MNGPYTADDPPKAGSNSLCRLRLLLALHFELSHTKYFLVRHIYHKLNGATQFPRRDTFECQQISCCSSTLFIWYVFCVLQLRLRELHVLDFSNNFISGSIPMHCPGRRIWRFLTFHPIISVGQSHRPWQCSPSYQSSVWLTITWWDRSPPSPTQVLR